MPKRSFKVTVSFERRDDGGLRAWSNYLPGVVLSHTDVDGVLTDLKSAIECILSERIGERFEVLPLENIRETLDGDRIRDPKVPYFSMSKEYTALCG